MQTDKFSLGFYILQQIISVGIYEEKFFKKSELGLFAFFFLLPLLLFFPKQNSTLSGSFLLESLGEVVSVAERLYR